MATSGESSKESETPNTSKNEEATESFDDFYSEVSHTGSLVCICCTRVVTFMLACLIHSVFSQIL